MDLKAWEATIQQIAAEFDHEPKESGKQRVLTAWRATLEREPTSLPLFQIDEIVRHRQKSINVAHTENQLKDAQSPFEVRKRMTKGQGLNPSDS